MYQFNFINKNIFNIYGDIKNWNCNHNINKKFNQHLLFAFPNIGEDAAIRCTIFFY